MFNSEVLFDEFSSSPFYVHYYEEHYLVEHLHDWSCS